MSDRKCVALLQRVLPRMKLRWRGFSNLRGQVCKRISRRMRELGLAEVDAYGALLERDPQEWAHFDSFCRITISRFYRDRAVFERMVARLRQGGLMVIGGHERLPEGAEARLGLSPASGALPIFRLGGTSVRRW